MTRQDLFNQVAEAIKSGDYKCIHYGQRDGSMNIVITLASDLMCFVNENGTANILCKGNEGMLHISRQELIDLSIEGQAAAEERKRQEEEKARLQAIEDMKDKLPRWREQQAILQAKIEEAERMTKEDFTKQITCPMEHPDTPEEAATPPVNSQYAENIKHMIDESKGQPLPSLADIYPGSYDKIKERAQASLKKTMEKAERSDKLPSDNWLKRLLRRKE